MIDEVRVYNVALSQPQIQADMNTPIGPSTAAQPPTTNLTATGGAGQVNLSWTASTGNCGQLSGGASGPGKFHLCADWNVDGHDVQRHQRFRWCDLQLSRTGARISSGNLSPYSNVAQATAVLGINPHVVELTFTQTQQFTANGSGVTWSVDGVVGGSAATGTITSTGLYTPPSSIGTHTVTATSAAQSQSDNATVYVTNYAGTFTYHNDNFRTGANLNETVLTPANVNSTTFGKLFSYALDGYALCLATLRGQREHSGQGLPQCRLRCDGARQRLRLRCRRLEQCTAVAGELHQSGCWRYDRSLRRYGRRMDIKPEIGITGTPVIDPTTGTLYVVAKTKEVVGGNTNYVQRLHALDITTGAEKFGGPVVIQASVPGTGDGSQGGIVTFNSLRQLQRPALLLSNGVVYIAFGSHGDNPPYHGWVLGYNATTLQQVMVYNDTANGSDGGIWQSGGGLDADTAGNIYFSIGNGTFDANTGGVDYGDSIVKLSPTGAVLDYFTPFDQASLSAADVDLGTSSPMLLPNQSGPNPHLLVMAGKGGTLYLVNRDNMGKFNSNNNNQIVQSLVNIFPHGGIDPTAAGNYSNPVYFNGTVYYGAVRDNDQGLPVEQRVTVNNADIPIFNNLPVSRRHTRDFSQRQHKRDPVGRGTDRQYVAPRWWTRCSPRLRCNQPGHRAVQQQPVRIARHHGVRGKVRHPNCGERKGLCWRRRPIDGVRAVAVKRRADGRWVLDTGADPSRHERAGRPGFRRLFGRPSRGGFVFDADTTYSGPRQRCRHGNGDHAGSVPVE